MRAGWGGTSVGFIWRTATVAFVISAACLWFWGLVYEVKVWGFEVDCVAFKEEQLHFRSKWTYEG